MSTIQSKCLDTKGRARADGLVQRANWSRNAAMFLVVSAAAVSALTRDAGAASHPQQLAATSTAAAIVLPARAPRNQAPAGKSVRGPMQIVVSIPDQSIDVFSGTERIATSRVSSGASGHDTPEGVFSILEKNRQHYSNIYGGAPMPFMQRLTWTGIALHASGSVPNYPASHGCIRLPPSFAKALFEMTSKGAHVIVNRGRQSPVVFEHGTLFQPRTRSDSSQAAAINALSLKGLEGPALTRSDREVLLEKKAGKFVAALRYAYDPNPGSHQRATIRLVQKLLGVLGYEIERADGDLGPKTRRAITAFQRDHRIAATGRPSEQLTTALYWTLARRMVGMEAAEADALLTPPNAEEPLRILITRAVEFDETKRAQRMLEQMGYYIGAIDGSLGRWTRSAIKQFRAKAGLPSRIEVDQDLLDALTLATSTAGGAGADDNGRADRSNAAEDNATGHIYVRQGARDIYDAPIAIKEIELPLGTHVFTAMDFGDQRDAKVTWTALQVAERRNEADQNTAVLDRVVIPPSVRAHIEELMTPGSSLIVSDHGISHETGEGTDFVVLTK